jgi:hypothetical protein
MPKSWTKAEEDRLKELYPKLTLRELFSHFPDRSGDSLDKKAWKLGLRKASESDEDKKEEESPEKKVLRALQTEDFPIGIEEIATRTELRLSDRKLSAIIDSLSDDGYDISEVQTGTETKYGMVRTAGFNPDSFYKFQGEIETPVLMTGDWHIGNKQHSRTGFEKMLESIEENSVASLMIDGDMFQGLGVYKTEAADLSIFSLEKQVEVGASYLKEIPDCVKTIGITIGTHESVAKGRHTVGYDMCKAVAKEIPRARYYGFAGKLQLDGDWDYTMMHSDGAVGYAVSYKGQRIRDILVQQPHILHLAHIHVPYDLSRPHTLGRASTITSSSLKREGAWEVQKGWTSIVGWFILRNWSPTSKTLIEYAPKVS